MTLQAPAIHITSSGRGIRIAQHRPALTDLLAGLPVAEALEQIPGLLPICGSAQSIAAKRAVSTVRGTMESDEERRERERAMLLEQARAAGWRLAIDWPDLLGESRDLEDLAHMQRSDAPLELAQALLSYIPGLAAVDNTDELLDWIAARDCLAARVIRRAAELDDSATASAATRSQGSGETLATVATAAMAAEPFDPLNPDAPAIEVGPLAMKRDPLIEDLGGEQSIGPLARRLLAQLLDTRFIARALTQDSPQAEDEIGAWRLGERQALGAAMTARGPVFHRVTLQEDRDTVADWRVIAPTDWHFSARGPLVEAANDGSRSRDWLRFLVAGFDPCAAWTVASEGQADA